MQRILPISGLIAILFFIIYAIYWLKKDNFIVDIIIHPKSSPSSIVKVNHVGVYCIGIRSLDSKIDLTKYKSDISITIVEGQNGQITEYEYAKTDKNLGYAFRGYGNYSLKIDFKHPDKWPDVRFIVYESGP